MNKTAIKEGGFKSLHIKGDPLVLYNVWDAGSAKIVANAGAKAIATGSWAVAAANGFEDGEKLPRELALQNFKLIIDAVQLPVSVDIESGYGAAPHAVADMVTRVAELGAAGINLEDQVIGEKSLYEIEEQAARISACREAIDVAQVSVFINARTDIFLQAASDAEIDHLLRETIERAKAYHKAGADGIFVPGLVNKKAIKTICEISPIPVNILIAPNGPPIEDLAKLGVARISHGPATYRASMEVLEAGAKAIYS